MSLISIQNLSFSYEGSHDTVFENVSFQIDSNWKLGFVGRNGRGKTTFLNLLLGKYPYSGKIQSALPFEYFPYTISHPSQNCFTIVQQICTYAERWQIERELGLLQVDSEVLDRAFDTLSNGEQTKLLLAALFLQEDCFLLIDEPTNHLDIDARKLLGQYLQSKKGFILVSHDRTLLDTCTTHTLSINRQDITVQQGNFSVWQHNKELQDSHELAQNGKLKKEIGRLQQSAKQAEAWAGKAEVSKKGKQSSGLKADTGYLGHKAAKMMKHSKNQEARMLKAADQKSGLLKNIEQSEALKLSPLSYPKSTLFQADSLSLYYREKPVILNLSFTIQNGERIVLSGRNGCGKSTLLKFILGDTIRYTGNFSRASNLKISYVSQKTDNLQGSLHTFAAKGHIDYSLFLTVLRKFGFERVQFEKNIESFSNGQKKKVLLAASLCQQAHLYVWDEPLNYIDLLSRLQIEELLVGFKPTMIFVEHDLAFQQQIATKTIFL